MLEGWPEAPAAEVWLIGWLCIAEAEAAELADAVVGPEHLTLALTRDDHGGAAAIGQAGLDPRRVRDFVSYICGVNEARAAARAGRKYRRTAKNRPAPPAPERLARDAGPVVLAALQEAAGTGTPVTPAHALVALARRAGAPGFFGLTPAAARAALGLPPAPHPADYAHLLDRRPTHRPPRRVGALVLGGGGDDVFAEAFARLDRAPGGRDRPMVAFVGAADPAGGAGLHARRVDAAGGRIVDTGIDDRASAQASAGLEALREADVVYLAGGVPERLVDAFVGTPAMDALVDASDAGAVVMGSSAGALVLGEATYSHRVTDDGYARLSTFGWLPGLAVTPHWADSPALADLHEPMMATVLADVAELRIPDAGAVWVAPGWQEMHTLRLGELGTPAALARPPNRLHQVLPPAPPPPSRRRT